VDEGLVRSIGVSNFSLPQVEMLLEGGRIKPCVNQVEAHPLLAQRKLVGVSWRKGVVTVGYAPLGSHKTKEVLEHPVVKKIAEETGKTPAQVKGGG
jgi:diketogulonate reductase-like aldo/keto reductase